MLRVRWGTVLGKGRIRVRLVFCLVRVWYGLEKVRNR